MTRWWFQRFSLMHMGLGVIGLPSRKLTYPTEREPGEVRENHRLKMDFSGDMLVPRRVPNHFPEDET